MYRTLEAFTFEGNIFVTRSYAKTMKQNLTFQASDCYL